MCVVLGRPTVAAMMAPAKDTFELFVRAMPIIQVLINEGNNIIMNSGENLDVNVEQVARNWVENVKTGKFFIIFRKF